VFHLNVYSRHNLKRSIPLDSRSQRETETAPPHLCWASQSALLHPMNNMAPRTARTIKLYLFQHYRSYSKLHGRRAKASEARENPPPDDVTAVHRGRWRKVRGDQVGTKKMIVVKNRPPFLGLHCDICFSICFFVEYLGISSLQLLTQTWAFWFTVQFFYMIDTHFLCCITESY